MGRKRSCQPDLQNHNNRPLSASSTSGNVIRGQNLDQDTNQATGVLSRDHSHDRKNMNDDLLGLDKRQSGATKQLHNHILNSKDQISSNGLATRASDAKTQ